MYFWSIIDLYIQIWWDVSPAKGFHRKWAAGPSRSSGRPSSRGCGPPTRGPSPRCPWSPRALLRTGYIATIDTRQQCVNNNDVIFRTTKRQQCSNNDDKTCISNVIHSHWRLQQFINNNYYDSQDDKRQHCGNNNDTTCFSLLLPHYCLLTSCYIHYEWGVELLPTQYNRVNNNNYYYDSQDNKRQQYR